MWAKKQAEAWVDPYAVELKRRERWSDRRAVAIGVAVAALFVLWLSSTDVWLACEMRQYFASCYERCGPPAESGPRDLGATLLCT